MKKKYLLYPYPETKSERTSRKGTRDYEIITSYSVNVELLNKIRALAYWERSTMREILEKAIKEFVYRKGPIKLKNPSQDYTENNDKVTAFSLREEFVNKVKALAYWETGTIKVIIDKILTSYINKYESKNGIIKPKPKKK